MVDVGRARRLSKRIATIVATAIVCEIKDPPLAFVPITDTKVEDLLARARAADEDLARVRRGAKHAGDEDPYRVTGAEEIGGEPDSRQDAEDTVDRD